MKIPDQPTAEQCTAHAPLGDGWYAIWYPQMGGYAGIAAVYVEPSRLRGDTGNCVEIAVWHDGEFPFIGSDSERNAVILHHCDIAQFRTLADDIERLQAQCMSKAAQES